MKIYTKTGDKGQTSLANGNRVPKFHPQIEAYGTADELNAVVGWLRASYASSQLEWIQNRLFDLGATLAEASMHITAADSAQLEQWIDEMQTSLPSLHAFVLPAGSEAVCRCHIARTITRRLERNMLQNNRDEDWEEELIFVNRLSDYFFVLARFITCQSNQKEEIWQKK